MFLLLPAIGLAAPKVELAPNTPPKLVLAPNPPVVELLPAPNVVLDGLTKPPAEKVVVPAPKAEADAGVPKEPAAAPRLPKVAVGAAVPSANVGGPAWLLNNVNMNMMEETLKDCTQNVNLLIKFNLLRREFLACTRGSVGAENGLGPEREGRGAAWVGFFRTSFVSKTGAVPCSDRCSCRYEAFWTASAWCNPWYLAARSVKAACSF